MPQRGFLEDSSIWLQRWSKKKKKKTMKLIGNLGSRTPRRASRHQVAGGGGGLNHATVSRHTRRLQLLPLTGDIKEPAASDGSTMERKTPRQRNERLSSALILESGPDKDASVGKEPVTGDDRVSLRCRSSAPLSSRITETDPQKLLFTGCTTQERGQEITTTRHLGI